MFLCSVYESFKEYIAVETLDGDNKYDAGNFGMQVSTKVTSKLSLRLPVFTLYVFVAGSEERCDFSQLPNCPASTIDALPIRSSYRCQR